MLTTMSVRKGLNAIVVGVAVSVLGVSSMAVTACSSADAASAEGPALTLNGRYAITSASGSVAYSAMWFSSNGKTFEGVLSNCTSSCTRTGTFTYEEGILNVTSSDGGPSVELSLKPDGSLATKSLRIRTQGSIPEDPASGNPCEVGRMLLIPLECAKTLMGFESSDGTMGKFNGFTPPSQLPPPPVKVAGNGCITVYSATADCKGVCEQGGLTLQSCRSTNEGYKAQCCA